MSSPEGSLRNEDRPWHRQSQTPTEDASCRVRRLKARLGESRSPLPDPTRRVLKLIRTLKNTIAFNTDSRVRVQIRGDNRDRANVMADRRGGDRRRKRKDTKERGIS